MTEVTILPGDRRPFFTTKTLASYLAISERTVRDMLREGKIPSYRFEGSRRIAAEDVDTYVDAHRDRGVRAA